MPNSTTNKRRRAYIGNLRPRPNLSQNLYNDLFLPHCLHVKNYPGGDGIAVASPKIPHSNRNRQNNDDWSSSTTKSSTPSSMYALVEFQDVDYAIQVLNGVQFDGRTLRVSKEKTNNSAFGSKGFGSSSWAGDDGRRDGFGSSNRRGGKHSNKQPQPRRERGEDTKNSASIREMQNNSINNGDDWNADEEETIVKGIESTISSEIKESSDEVTAAIACTAAMTLLSSVDAFGLDDTTNEEENNLVDELTTAKTNASSNEDNVDGNFFTNQDFQSRCKLPLSELLAEYGEQDVDWKKQKQPQQQQQPKQSYQAATKGSEQQQDLTSHDFQSRCKMPLSELLAEYGEQDVDWKKEQQRNQSSSARLNTNSNGKHSTNNNQSSQHKQTRNNNNHTDDNNNNNNGMLAHYNKSSIHLELVSFGYKYGAPSHAKKRGFTYAHPLPPLDVRDLDRAPHNVAKFNGLSHLVKRALLNPRKEESKKEEEEEEEVGDNARDSQQGQSSPSPMRQKANDIADEVIQMLVESIDEGGHGPISPLTMTISIGSEYGRHRAVVLVEHLAVVLRARLRRNDGKSFEDSGNDNNVDGRRPGKNNGIVRQTVSVGTRHRDVEARHVDEEAFGEDLKREARKVERMKRREMEEDNGWDGGSW